MMSSPLVQVMLDITLVVLVALLIPTAYRMVKGPRIADRMLALDMITTLLLGLIVVLSAIEGVSLLVDVGLGLAALSFIGTLAIARFVGEGRVF